MKLHKFQLKATPTSAGPLQANFKLLCWYITHAGLIGRLGFHFKHWLYGERLAERAHTQRANFSHLTCDPPN